MELLYFLHKCLTEKHDKNAFRVLNISFEICIKSILNRKSRTFDASEDTSKARPRFQPTPKGMSFAAQKVCKQLSFYKQLKLFTPSRYGISSSPRL